MLAWLWLLGAHFQHENCKLLMAPSCFILDEDGAQPKASRQERLDTSDHSNELVRVLPCKRS